MAGPAVSAGGRRFEPYAGFEGRIGTTMAASEPWWPPRPRARRGAPNVVVVLADDLGFSDLGCFGSEIETPHLDATAAAGVRWTNFRVTPLCSPTRAALLTGLNSHAAGVAFPTHVDPGFPNHTSELPRDTPTLAEVLRHNGYATLMVGKWHLCKDEDFSEAGDRRNWPLQRGFDQYYGFLEALTDFHHPHRMIEGNSVVHVDEYPDDYYLTDDLTDRALRMVREVRAADPDKPFLLYFSHGAVHAPMHAKRSDIEAQRGRYDAGWDVVRAARLAKQIELGIMPPGTELPPSNHEDGLSVGAWEDLDDVERQVFARYMEVYAAMVTSMDDSLGRLRALLAELGELDNTLIVFSSDNGAARLTDKSDTPPGEGTTPDTGTPSYFGYIQDPAAASHDPHAVIDRLDELGGPTTWPHYPRGWAQVCNTPFRLYKFSTLRGGQQSPLVLSWPDGPGTPGSIVSRAYTHVTDVLPTLVDMLGLDVPPGPTGDAAYEPAGTSFAATVADVDAPSAHHEQYTECVGNRSFYRDGWEAATVRRPLTPFSEERWQLFDVQADPTQAHDLAAERPEKLAELVAGFEEAAWANQVYPMDEGSGLKFLLTPERPGDRPLRILPGTPTLERHRSSMLTLGRPWTAVVEVRARTEDEGVLLSHGSQAAGYLLFVEAGRLLFEQNQYGRPVRFDAGPWGDDVREVRLEVALPSPRTWDVVVRVDGTATLEAPGLPAFVGFLPFEGIDIGICRRSPVSWELYRRRRSFAFTGDLVAVTYRPGPVDHAARERQLADARQAGLDLQ